MDTQENTTSAEVPTADAVKSEAAAASAAVPGMLGRLTPEEQQRLLAIRQESQQLLQKLGEFDVQKARIMGRIETLDAEGHEVVNTISQRLGLQEGQQWVALVDGSIRVVNPVSTEGPASS